MRKHAVKILCGLPVLALVLLLLFAAITRYCDRRK